MKKTRIPAMLLCIAMLLCCVFLPACDAGSDAGNIPDNTPAGDKGSTPGPDQGGTTDPENKLYGKTVIWNGDSICQGATSTGTWADRIAEKNGIKKWKNYGVGGGTIVENAPRYENGNERHSVSATLEKMQWEFPDADYIILEGGTNDADLLGRITGEEIAGRFGSFDPNDFSGEYNRETFCGALESIFYRAKQLWPDAKICYIVAQKMGTNANVSANRYAYFQVAMQICEKWEIPYLNLWDGCNLDPTIPEMYDPNKTVEENEQISMYKDGQHLTNAGYDYTSDIINAWLKTL